MIGKLTINEVDNEYGARITTIIESEDFGNLAQECLKRMDVMSAYSLLGALRTQYGKRTV